MAYVTAPKIVPQNKIKAPLFCLGQVIDLSYKHGGNPNRLRIEEIRFTADKDEWQYKVQLESNPIGTTTFTTESFIQERACNKFAKVYLKDIVKKRYKDGWRFCGNFPAEKATEHGNALTQLSNVKNVRVTEAYDHVGDYVYNQLAVWIRYETTINDNGNIKAQPVEYEQVTFDLK